MHLRDAHKTGMGNRHTKERAAWRITIGPKRERGKHRSCEQEREPNDLVEQFMYKGQTGLMTSE